mgnify:CR=1 FL=1
MTLPIKNSFFLSSQKKSIEKLMSLTSEINLAIHLDEKNIPERILWDATDAQQEGIKVTQAMLLALWDAKAKTGLSIDLWTKEMTVQEMNLFFYQTFITMSETFQRATNNEAMAKMISTFANEFIEEIKRQEKIAAQ